MNNAKPIIVALDGISREQALSLAEPLQGRVWGFKVNDMLLEHGVSIISELKKYGNVFADPKLHDIPNTVANGVKRLESAGADLITVHAGGGLPMLKAAVKNTETAKILAVTVLTSFCDVDSQQVFSRPVEDAVLNFAELAAEAKIHGIVCSPHELRLLHTYPAAQSLAKVTPGIRPAWHQKQDDQARAMTPAQAVSLGASLLVIGRPITQASNPIEAAESILEELSQSG